MTDTLSQFTGFEKVCIRISSGVRTSGIREISSLLADEKFPVRIVELETRLHEQVGRISMPTGKTDLEGDWIVTRSFD